MSTLEISAVMLVKHIFDNLHTFLFMSNIRKSRLMKFSFILPCISVLYLLTCLWLGPLFMRYRKPFNVKPLIVAYDAFQVVFNAYLFIKLSPLAFSFDWSLHCPSDREEVINRIETGYEMYIWHLVLVKHIDLLDTAFFILRKKMEHVSALHIVHHSIMALCVYYVTCVDNTLTHFLPPTVLNCGIHSIMYAYYGITASGLKVDTKFKKVVTIMQIVQFFMVVAYLGVLYYNGCLNFVMTNIIPFCFVLYLLFMFIKFYGDNYLKKRDGKMKEA